MDVLRRLFRRFRREREPVAAPGGLHIEPLAGTRGFRLIGELDLYTVEAAREALAPELHGTLVLDLADLDYIDDSGLGLLVGIFKRLRQQGGLLVLRHPRGRIRRVLEITGLNTILTIEEISGESS